MRTWVLVLVGLVVAPGVAAANRLETDYVVIPVSGAVAAPSAEAGGAPTVFFLNRMGGTFRPGNDDARANTSSIIGAVSQIDPWQVSAAGWDQVLTCVQDMFSRFNVTVTDVDPGAATPHYEIVVAGSPQDIGMGQGVGGVSPFTEDCGVIPSSVVYTFAEVYGTDYQSICETAAQEVAHSFGLDHEHLCEDPMTYLYDCGPKSFQDVEAPCGEYSDRECWCGGTTQNSVAMLEARVGPANQAPGVAITHPSDGATVPRGFAIAVDATDTSAVADVELWIDGVQVGVDATAPYEFTAPVDLADGDHAVEARAVDDGGLGSVAAVMVTVSSDAPPPPLDDDSPAEQGWVTGGCAAGGGAGGLLVMLALACALARPRTGARRGSRGETGR